MDYAKYRVKVMELRDNIWIKSCLHDKPYTDDNGEIIYNGRTKKWYDMFFPKKCPKCANLKDYQGYNPDLFTSSDKDKETKHYYSSKECEQKCYLYIYFNHQDSTWPEISFTTHDLIESEFDYKGDLRIQFTDYYSREMFEDYVLKHKPTKHFSSLKEYKKWNNNL